MRTCRRRWTHDQCDDIFLRGDVEDYRGWTTLGNEGWSWDSLLPYFQKVRHPHEVSLGDTDLYGHVERELHCAR